MNQSSSNPREQKQPEDLENISSHNSPNPPYYSTDNAYSHPVYSTDSAHDDTVPPYQQPMAATWASQPIITSGNGPSETGVPIPQPTSSSRAPAYRDSEGLIPVERSNNDAEGLIPVVREPPVSEGLIPVAEEQPAIGKRGGKAASLAGPSPKSPFDFPPAYEGPNTTSIPPRSPTGVPTLIAIPQLISSPTSPFLPAYSTLLSRHGITEQSFANFLITLSAFLSATVSNRALAHVADVGRSLSEVPKDVGRQTASHVKSLKERIVADAKSGNYVGAAARSIFGGGVAVPVAAAFRVTAAATFGLPASLVVAASKKPQTSRERADAYVRVADRDWFASRGLKACLVSTVELLHIAQLAKHRAGEAGGASHGSPDDSYLTVDGLIETNRKLAQEGGAQAQTRALCERLGFAGLEVVGPAPPLDVGPRTLWFVLTDIESRLMDEMTYLGF